MAEIHADTLAARTVKSVSLDGNVMPRVTAFNTEEGWVERLDLFNRIDRQTGMIKVHRSYGVVTYETDDD